MLCVLNATSSSRAAIMLCVLNAIFGVFIFVSGYGGEPNLIVADNCTGLQAILCGHSYNVQPASTCCSGALPSTTAMHPGNSVKRWA
jgi:hypothetical protein